MTAHPNRNKVRDWSGYLKRYRDQHDLTQSDLADRLMVSKRLVENWEERINHPPPYLKLALEYIRGLIQRP